MMYSVQITNSNNEITAYTGLEFKQAFMLGWVLGGVIICPWGQTIGVKL